MRKSLAAALFVLACSVTVSADEAPAPRPADDKKPDAPGGKFGKFGGKFDPEKFKNIDPEKLKELKEKFGGKGGFGGKFDPEKLKEFKGKFGGKGGFDPEKFKGKFGKGGFDPEKLKELKEKFKKGNGDE